MVASGTAGAARERDRLALHYPLADLHEQAGNPPKKETDDEPENRNP